MFACVCAHHVEPGGGGGSSATSRVPGAGIESLSLLAAEFSPRVETIDDRIVVFDAAGLDRLFGGPRPLAEHVLASAAARGWTCGVAIARTRTAAMLLARACPGVTIVPAGREALVLAPLPVGLLPLVDACREDQGASASGADATHGSHARGRRKTTSGRHYRMAPSPVESGTDAKATGAQAGQEPAARPSQESSQLLDTLDRWGISTLGDLAALPGDRLHARLGTIAVRWQRLARGEDARPLVRDVPEERFEERLALEWPIEGLEPLSFVFARLLEPLCQHLERRDRGAVGLRVWLKLVTRAVHTRYLQLPVPMRDPKVLRTLLTLDLESHPSPAGIDEVTLACDVAPGRIVQHSLLTRPLPSPDRVSTLVARLTALMGEGRCGSPAVIDTHRAGVFAMSPFVPSSSAVVPALEGTTGAARPARKVVPAPRVADEGEAQERRGEPAAVLRRFRWPIPAQVTTREGRPDRVVTRQAGVRGGRVRQSAGPWRTSGAWWHTLPQAVARREAAWDRDEWDVALDDRVVYRISENRRSGEWVVEGYWD